MSSALKGYSHLILNDPEGCTHTKKLFEEAMLLYQNYPVLTLASEYAMYAQDVNQGTTKSSKASLKKLFKLTEKVLGIDKTVF